MTEMPRGAARATPWVARRTIWVAAFVAVLAFAVRVEGALHFALWQDEVGSARAILEATPLGTVRHVIRTESTPPAWYVLAWLVHRLGLSAEHVRIVSALAGGLLAGGLVIYARAMLPLWASALAALSVALGYEFVFHGRELRSYELYALASLALAMTSVRFGRVPNLKRGAILACVVAIGALTNYFFLLLLAAVLLWFWVSPAMRPVRLMATTAIVAGLLPFAVWVPAMARQYSHRGGYTYIGGFRVHTVLTTYWSLFARAQPQTAALHDAAPVVLLLAVVAGCVVLAIRSDVGQLTALLTLVPVAVAALFWVSGPKIYDIRNVIGVGPFAAVALAAVIAFLPTRAAMTSGCLAVALIVFGFVRSDRVPPVAYDRIARALMVEGWTPRDPILLLGNFYSFRSPLEWYLPQHPALTLGELGKKPCTRFFVVSGTNSAPRRILSPPSLGAIRYVRKILVARVDSDYRLAAHPSRGRNLLVALSGHSSCVRAVPEQQLNSKLSSAHTSLAHHLASFRVPTRLVGVNGAH